jgi:hypothetical protein
MISFIKKWFPIGVSILCFTSRHFNFWKIIWVWDIKFERIFWEFQCNSVEFSKFVNNEISIRHPSIGRSVTYVGPCPQLLMYSVPRSAIASLHASDKACQVALKVHPGTYLVMAMGNRSIISCDCDARDHTNDMQCAAKRRRNKQKMLRNIILFDLMSWVSSRPCLQVVPY